ncbi:MAG: HlyD family efflux transporter periplasmic adaptor subunit [Chloroflexi bacterium]|nr:HlyD family efflux transporter periplasmic adaptor subunit [Chloroflexota bacterium]
MRNRILAIVGLVILLIVGYWALNAYTASARATELAASMPVKIKATNLVSAEGIVVPAQRATLAFKTGGRVVEILAGEGDAVKAGTVLARLDDGILKNQVAQAQATLNVAQKQLAQLRAGGTPADRQAARDAVAAARAQYARVKAGPTTDELAVLKANVDGAQAALSQAQFRYDRIGGAANPFGGAAPESLALQQAFIALTAAQAAYRDALSHPTESDLQTAQAAITQAESALARLDPTAEALALAQAQVDQAQAALDLAKTAAQDAVLLAPFDGMVAVVAIDVGQVVGPGTPAITVGNLSKLRIETTDLAETDVARLSPGQPVKVTLDALPDQVLTGQIASIAPRATDYRGDQVFKVTVDVSDKTGLRWGMTANVEIGAAQ